MGKSLQYSIEPGSNRRVKKKDTQADKFVQAAKEHDCEESEEDFDEKLKRIAKAKEKPAK